ncbi:MAG: PilZ domain-containing protein [Proteobacteria bacterium]|nr:PilZ domain-containing protein [Pseudomonadota bacterium]MBU1581692.1 PilZ domain-containing protein [Pseudomonadota bacterium]MBU2455029.1 PilZ domain-containing protein [Pseudomonadota bacterium]
MKMLDEIINRVRNLTDDQQTQILEILKDWQTGKQREYQRLDARADIDVVIGNRVIQTKTKDLSAGGIYINTSGKFETDKSVRLVFSIPGHDKPFKLQGMIVRVEKSGMAIKFENITPYLKKILDDLIWEKKNKG